MSNYKHGGAAYPTTTVLIQGEIIKARGSKYFNFKGKRYLIADYLQTPTINEPGSLQTVNSDDETPSIKNNAKEVSNGDVTQTVKIKSNSLHMGSVVRQNADGGFTIYKNEKDAPPNGTLHRKPDSGSAIPHDVKTVYVNLPRESKHENDVNPRSGMMGMVTAHPVITSVIGAVLGGLALKYVTTHLDKEKQKQSEGNDW